jgi:hypothetical protein
MNRCLLLATLAGLLAGGCAPTQDSVTIRLRERAEGDVAIIEVDDTATVRSTATDARGTIIADDTRALSRSTAHRETILRRSVGRTTKAELEYTKAEFKEGDRETPSPLLGRPVVLEEKGGEYTVTYRGGPEVRGAAADELISSFTSFNRRVDDTEFDRMLLPPGAVRVGEPWPVDMAALARYYARVKGVAIDTGRATGTGVLRRAYAREGRRYGELQIKLEMPVGGSAAGGGKGAGDGSRMVLDITHDLCIDGTSSAGTSVVKSEITVRGPLAGVPGGTLLVVTTSEQRNVRKDLPSP